MASRLALAIALALLAVLSCLTCASCLALNVTRDDSSIASGSPEIITSVLAFEHSSRIVGGNQTTTNETRPSSRQNRYGSRPLQNATQEGDAAQQVFELYDGDDKSVDRVRDSQERHPTPTTQRSQPSAPPPSSPSSAVTPKPGGNGPNRTPSPKPTPSTVQTATRPSPTPTSSPTTKPKATSPPTDIHFPLVQSRAMQSPRATNRIFTPFFLFLHASDVSLCTLHALIGHTYTHTQTHSHTHTHTYTYTYTYKHTYTHSNDYTHTYT